MTKFAVVSYHGTDNLGDEIQSIAAAGNLPGIDGYFERDRLNEVEAHGGSRYSMILNGWFCQYPERWPPSPAVRPLLISMHFTQERVASAIQAIPAELLLAPPLSDYLKAHGPIGARDMTTLHLLRKAGIESYFSACMTLTLQRPEVQRASDLVVLNDLPREVMAHIRGVTSKNIFSTTHIGFRETGQQERFLRARELLSLYARASCVITGRLHCALPCLAMGTPVLMIDVAADQYRFKGLHDFVHHCGAADFMSGRFPYAIDAPPPNKTAHFRYRDDLRRRAAEFVKGAGSYSPRPASSDPDAAMLATILELHAGKGLPAPNYVALQPTFLKKTPVDSGSLPAAEKLAVTKFAVLTAKSVGMIDGHAILHDIQLNGRAVGGNGWVMYPPHWQAVGQVAASATK